MSDSVKEAEAGTVSVASAVKGSPKPDAKLPDGHCGTGKLCEPKANSFLNYHQRKHRCQ